MQRQQLLHCLPLFLVLRCAASEPLADSAVMLMILHQGHTGTHALCEAFGKLACVAAECIEIGFNVDDIGNFMRRAHSAGKRYAMRMYSMWDAHKSLEWLRSWAESGKLWYLTHVRLDLMRYSLSRLAGGNPQFFEGNGNVVQRVRYDPETLDRYASSIVSMWKSQIIGMMELPHGQTRAIFYEDLLLSQKVDATGMDRVEMYLLWILDMLGNTQPCARMAEASCISPELHRCAFYGVRKVHSDNISNFVSNSDEVLEHWAAKDRGDFMQIASGKSVPTSMLARWPKYWLPLWSSPMGPPPSPFVPPPPPPPQSPPPPSPPSPSPPPISPLPSLPPLSPPSLPPSPMPPSLPPPSVLLLGATPAHSVGAAVVGLCLLVTAICIKRCSAKEGRSKRSSVEGSAMVAPQDARQNHQDKKCKIPIRLRATRALKQKRAKKERKGMKSIPTTDDIQMIPDDGCAHEGEDVTANA